MTHSNSRRTESITLDMSKTGVQRFLFNKVVEARKRGYFRSFNLFVDSRNTTYPNICAPAAAIIDYFKNINKCSFNIADVAPTYGYVNHTNFVNPVLPTVTAQLASPLDKVWRFSSSKDVNLISTAILDAVRKSIPVQSGIIDSLTWCINEAMDNVLQHSDAPAGFLMCSIFRQNKRIAICIADAGIGIRASLNKSQQHHPNNDLDAITLALQENVTRDPAIGQGNGLWGLRELVRTNTGSLTIQSGTSEIGFVGNSSGKTKAFPYNKCKNITVVDFQFDLTVPVDVKAILDTPPVDFWKEAREVDFEGKIVKLVVANECDGTGTRKAGELFRNVILNTFSKCETIELDFSGTNIISSSFADEVIGKLLTMMGLVDFLQHIRLINTSKTIAGIINRTAMQRMSCASVENVGRDFDEKQPPHRRSFFSWRWKDCPSILSFC